MAYDDDDGVVVVMAMIMMAMMRFSLVWWGPFSLHTDVSKSASVSGYKPPHMENLNLFSSITFMNY